MVMKRGKNEILGTNGWSELPSWSGDKVRSSVIKKCFSFHPLTETIRTAGGGAGGG